MRSAASSPVSPQMFRLKAGARASRDAGGARILATAWALSARTTTNRDRGPGGTSRTSSYCNLRSLGFDATPLGRGLVDFEDVPLFQHVLLDAQPAQESVRATPIPRKNIASASPAQSQHDAG